MCFLVWYFRILFYDLGDVLNMRHICLEYIYFLMFGFVLEYAMFFHYLAYSMLFAHVNFGNMCTLLCCFFEGFGIADV